MNGKKNSLIPTLRSEENLADILTTFALMKTEAFTRNVGKVIPFMQESTEKQPPPDIPYMVQTDNMKMHNTLQTP